MDTPESNKQHHDRAMCFWYSDSESAGESLAHAAMEYRQDEWLNFVTDAANAARAQLKELLNKQPNPNPNQ